MTPCEPAVGQACKAAKPQASEARPETQEPDVAPPNSVVAYQLTDGGLNPVALQSKQEHGGATPGTELLGDTWNNPKALIGTAVDIRSGVVPPPVSMVPVRDTQTPPEQGGRRGPPELSAAISGEHEVVRRFNEMARQVGADRQKPVGRSAMTTHRPAGLRDRRLTEAMGEDRDRLLRPGLEALEEPSQQLLGVFEQQAMQAAHAMLAHNEQIANSEARRYGENSSGYPMTQANQLRTAARQLGDIQREIIVRLQAHGSSVMARDDVPFAGPPQATVTADRFDDFIEGSLAHSEPEPAVIQRNLLPRLNVLKRIYGPEFPILLKRNTNYTAIAEADPATLARIVGQSTGQVLRSIQEMRKKLKADTDKIWSLPLLVEAAKRQMGIPLEASTPAGAVIDRKQAQVESDEALFNLALTALGITLAVAATALSMGAAGPVAAATAAGWTSGGLALASAGLSVYQGLEEYSRHELQAAAAGSSLDPATALAREEPSLLWLAVAIVGAIVDVGAAAMVFRNLAAAARITSSAGDLRALEEAARAQARVLAAERRLGRMTEDEFVKAITDAPKTAKPVDPGAPGKTATPDQPSTAAPPKATASPKTVGEKPVFVLKSLNDPTGEQIIIKPIKQLAVFHSPSAGDPPPAVVLQTGLSARGTNTNLWDHVTEIPGSAFRGTTLLPGQAAQWDSPVVYKIRNIDTYDVNAATAKIDKGLPGFSGNPMYGENEFAIKAVVPASQIEGYYPVVGGKLGPFVPNPNFKPPPSLTPPTGTPAPPSPALGKTATPDQPSTAEPSKGSAAKATPPAPVGSSGTAARRAKADKSAHSPLDEGGAPAKSKTPDGPPATKGQEAVSLPELEKPVATSKPDQPGTQQQTKLPSEPPKPAPKPAGAGENGPYTGVPKGRGEIPPRTGAHFTPTQKKKIIEANRLRNGGRLRSDDPLDPYQDLSDPVKSVSPGMGGQPQDRAMAAVDHIVPRGAGGSNSYGNARVISQHYNNLLRDKHVKGK